jgi:hypothetical protein
VQREREKIFIYQLGCRRNFDHSQKVGLRVMYADWASPLDVEKDRKKKKKKKKKEKKKK